MAGPTIATPRPVTGGRQSRLSSRYRRAFWLFLSPWLVGFVLFTGGPISGSAVLSFTDYTVTSSPNGVGFSNYSTLFGDDLFVKSLQVTAYYAGLSVAIGIVSALAVAMLLNQKLYFRNVFRTIIYIPTVVSGVVAALLWQWLLNPCGGYHANPH